MKISIVGLGWYGYPLALELKKLGHSVFGTSRSEEKLLNFKHQGIDAEILNYPDVPGDNILQSDILILNIPPFKEELQWFKNWNWNKNTKIIFISSTSVFTTPESKNAQILSEQEEWVKSNFTSWVVIRFAGLMGNGRHPGKSLSGKMNLSGRLSPVNLIHLTDTIGFTITVIEKNIYNEVFNLASDEHPGREEFYTDYCLKNALPLPVFDPSDSEVKHIVPNEEVKKIYTFKSSIYSW
jgi:nucleoside-diphosphate-sugar epimerase